MTLSSLTDRSFPTVIVTGAAGGIGRALTVRLIQAGYGLVLSDLDSTSLMNLVADVEAAARQTGRGGNRISAVTGDIANEDVWQEIIAAPRPGPLVGLCNVAGVQGRAGPITNISTADFLDIFRVNVVSVMLGMRTIIPELVANSGGSIVNFASVAGIRGVAMYAPYTAAKHAVVGLSRAAAIEYAPVRVRVNALCPGPTNTTMMADVARSLSPQDPERMAGRIAATNPMQRLATADEVAAAAAWLLSDDSSYLTGVALPVDGGLTAR